MFEEDCMNNTFNRDCADFAMGMNYMTPNYVCPMMNYYMRPNYVCPYVWMKKMQWMMKEDDTCNFEKRRMDDIFEDDEQEQDAFRGCNCGKSTSTNYDLKMKKIHISEITD